MENFKQFLSEQSDEQPYKLVIFHNSHENVRDVGKPTAPDVQLLQKTATEKLGIKLFNAEYSGCYFSEKNGKLFINSFAFDDDTGKAIIPTEDGKTKYQKPFEINPKDTLIFTRGLGTPGFTTNRRWVDMVKILEDKGFKTMPSLETWDLCTSKYYCSELFKNNGLKTPKTIPITYSDDSERAIKENNFKFPVILKASSGSQTGVGVVIIESLRSLHPTVQMLTLLNKSSDLIIQEYIKIDYDVRAIVFRGEVIAAMKRDVMSGDVRSNVSLGATTKPHELTELETKDCLKSAELVKGELIGVDFMPAKNREKEQPYILEVNSMPGFGGIERATKNKSVTEEILKTYMNRNNWRMDND